MAIRPSLRPTGGWVLTEQGRHDLVVAETCDCHARLSGLLLECPECGTIYGYLRDEVRGAGYTREKF